jgi:predicted DNA-binding transcriptional regulator AlpA
MSTGTKRDDDRRDPWIDLKEVEQYTGLDRKRIMGDGTPERRGMVALGTFDPPFRLTPKGKWYWRRSTILTWMEKAEKMYPWTPPAANDNEPIAEVELDEDSPEAPPDDGGDIE